MGRTGVGEVGVVVVDGTRSGEAYEVRVLDFLELDHGGCGTGSAE